jgi:plasmid stabilization system protein ParE
LEEEAKDRFRFLGDEPLLFAVRFADVRRANLRKFPFGMFYFVADETVVVIGVLHAARDTEAELRRRRQAFGALGDG